MKIVCKDGQVQSVEIKPVIRHLNDLAHKASADTLTLIVVMHSDTNGSTVYLPAICAMNIAASNNFTIENR
ncbi:hypothetical protein CEV32_2600 [Brucella rhizosphaerae]|uniref:Uncharacterized protein n=1 Tax=Brucella rhizosphaerae TaxID=571254 RepID=A0A256F5T9_9HYPH|nr:hypothetical protein CEV32_2600 [Brucella rhizosphaerae]